MGKRKTYILLDESGRQINCETPGVYAGWRPGKIFGRLLCPAQQMLPRNRVFFLSYEAAINCGYRPCKKCRPDVLRVGDRVDYSHPALEAISKKPHIALWESSPPPRKVLRRTKHYPLNRDKYVAMNWSPNPNSSWPGQVTLSDWFFYSKARSVAIYFGKMLNLPVIYHCTVDVKVLWLPERDSHPDEKVWVGNIQTNGPGKLYIGAGAGK